MRTHRTRLILNALLVASILLLPWWVSALLLVALVGLFRAYEAPFLALFADVLYGSALPAFFGFEYVLTAGILVLFVIAENVKKRLVFFE